MNSSLGVLLALSPVVLVGCELLAGIEDITYSADGSTAISASSGSPATSGNENASGVTSEQPEVMGGSTVDTALGPSESGGTSGAGSGSTTGSPGSGQTGGASSGSPVSGSVNASGAATGSFTGTSTSAGAGITADSDSPAADAGTTEAPSDSGTGAADSSVDATLSSDSSDATSVPLEALSRAGWAATAYANETGTWPATNSPDNALDGNPDTRWTSGEPQAAGDFFQVDMTKVQTFSEIVLDSGATSTLDYPRQFDVDVSTDAVTWSQVATGMGTTEITTVAFGKQTARYIRIVLSETPDTVYWWSIAELNVFGP